MRKLLEECCFSCRLFLSNDTTELCWTWCSLKSPMTKWVRQSIPHLWCHVCARSADLLPASLQGQSVFAHHAVIPQNSLVAMTKSYQYRTCCKYEMHKIQHTNSARWLLLKRLAKPKSSIFNLAQSCRSSHESQYQQWHGTSQPSRFVLAAVDEIPQANCGHQMLRNVVAKLIQI